MSPQATIKKNLLQLNAKITFIEIKAKTTCYLCFDFVFFSRLCLHAIYNHRNKTTEQWRQLPALFEEWLNIKSFIMMSYRSPSSSSHVALGHGPLLSSLSVML